MSAPSGFIVVWSCLCSDAADHASWLPEVCPDHGLPRAGDIQENPWPGGTAPGHRCGERTCPTRRNDTARNPDTHAETEGASA